MSEASWQFRTTRGVVTVRADAIAVRSTPGHFLAGQRRRWRHGDRWERAKTLFLLGGYLASMVGIAAHLFGVGAAGPGLRSVPYAFTALLFAYALWDTHVGETTIPLSTVDAVTLDEDDGVLTVSHEPRGRLRWLLVADASETTLSLPTDDDCREAREILRLRGIDLRAPDAGETETTYRVRVRDGACFCVRCASQVSPSDGSCPACGYAIRVRTPVDGPPTAARVLEREG